LKIKHYLISFIIPFFSPFRLSILGFKVSLCHSCKSAGRSEINAESTIQITVKIIRLKNIDNWNTLLKIF